jgi:hypothetical protein
MMASAAFGRLGFARGGWRLVAALSLAVLYLCVIVATGAADTFLGVEVAPLQGAYVVKQETVLRDRPRADGRRTGALQRGDKVRAVGTAPGGWLAIRKDGDDVGFASQATLLPLIDGALDQTLDGKMVVSRDVKCSYEISHTGKTPVEGGLFDISDYELSYGCDVRGKMIDVEGYMFITEAPYEQTSAPEYQISVDLPQIGTGDELLSTTFIYRKEKGEVVFDNVALEEFRKRPTVASKKVDSVPEALKGAAELAPGAWNDAAWEALTKISR